MNDARALLDDARRAYLTALRRACDAGLPVAELREDSNATACAAGQLIGLAVAQRIVPGGQA